MRAQMESKLREIIKFSECIQKEKWIDEIERQDWSAAKFLSGLLRESQLLKTLGNGAELYITADGEKLVSFAVLSPKDAINDDSLTPWIGFIYTAPEYRGNRESGRLIDYLCEIARDKDYKKVYLCTDHIGLYEKYGFIYMENRIDVWGEDSRIYFRNL